MGKSTAATVIAEGTCGNFYYCRNLSSIEIPNSDDFTTLDNSSTVGLEQSQQNSTARLNIYPNPATSTININNPTNIEVSVYTSDGALIKRTSSNRMDLSNQPAGVFTSCVQATKTQGLLRSRL
ncbi:MAG: T9SS type A sorting domain-containing protein [Bacteroidales bacterium]|jgi:hypothetical protein|nr:T9SS type A sorting domain-containing protein [Bacteroidales bacterium]